MALLHPTAYGDGNVRVRLKDRTREQYAETIILPHPSKRELTPDKEAETFSFYKDRRVEEETLGFRYTLVLGWKKYDTQADLDKVLRVAQWKDILYVTPFDDYPYGFEMQIPKGGIRIEPQGDKLDVPQYVEITMVGTVTLPRLVISDNLFYAALGAPAVQNSTIEKHLLFRAMVIHP